MGHECYSEMALWLADGTTTSTWTRRTVECFEYSLVCYQSTSECALAGPPRTSLSFYYVIIDINATLIGLISLPKLSSSTLQLSFVC